MLTNLLHLRVRGTPTLQPLPRPGAGSARFGSSCAPRGKAEPTNGMYGMIEMYEALRDDEQAAKHTDPGTAATLDSRQ